MYEVGVLGEAKKVPKERGNWRGETTKKNFEEESTTALVQASRTTADSQSLWASVVSLLEDLSAAYVSLPPRGRTEQRDIRLRRLARYWKITTRSRIFSAPLTPTLLNGHQPDLEQKIQKHNTSKSKTEVYKYSEQLEDHKKERYHSLLFGEVVAFHI
eukprot:gene10730-7460_t